MTTDPTGGRMDPAAAPAGDLRRPPRRGGRRTVARHEQYAAAQRAVDHLSDARFPVEHITIVGGGLRYVEQIDEAYAYEAQRLLERMPARP